MTIEAEIEILYDDIFDAKYALKVYKVLYMESENNIKLLNSSSPLFFHRHREILQHYLILLVCKMTEPRSNKGKQHITLDCLVNDKVKIETKRFMKKQIKEARTMAQIVKKHRNNYVVHRSALVAIKNETVPSFKISLIEDCINIAFQCLRAYYVEVNDADIDSEIHESATPLLIESLQRSKFLKSLLRKDHKLREEWNSWRLSQ